MSRTVDADTAAYVDRLRAELPAAIAACRAKEIAYFGSEFDVPDPQDVRLAVVVEDDGLPTLVIDLTVPFPGGAAPYRASFRFDAEWRRIQDVEHPGGFVDHIASALVSGFEYDTTDTPPSPSELAEVEAELPGAGPLWRDLQRSLSGTVNSDGHLVIDRTTLAITPEQWRQHVTTWEIGARRDSGIDAMRAGQGPAFAVQDLEELIACSGPVPFVVWWRDRLHPSRRRELPPV